MARKGRRSVRNCVGKVGPACPCVLPLILRRFRLCFAQSYKDYDDVGVSTAYSRTEYVKDCRDRLRAAARLASAWRCRNIASFRGVVLSRSTGDVKYVVMNASATSAGEFLKKCEDTCVETIEKLAFDVLSALSYLHGRDVPVAQRRLLLETISVFRDGDGVVFLLPIPWLRFQPSGSTRHPWKPAPASPADLQDDMKQFGMLIAEAAAAMLKCDVPALELPASLVSRGIVVLSRLSPRLAEVVKDCTSCVGTTVPTAAAAVYALRPWPPLSSCAVWNPSWKPSRMNWQKRAGSMRSFSVN
jgi:hypothetical protein